MTTGVSATDRADMHANDDVADTSGMHASRHGNEAVVRLEVALAYMERSLSDTKTELRELRGTTDRMNEKTTRLETKLRFMPSKVFMLVGFVLLAILVAVLIDQQRKEQIAQQSSRFGSQI